MPSIKYTNKYKTANKSVLEAEPVPRQVPEEKVQSGLKLNAVSEKVLDFVRMLDYYF